jgi:negative regulator of flagellin synthesis FlgM
MNINSSNSIKSGSSTGFTGGTARLGKGAAGASSASSGGGERVQLSQFASQLQAMESSMADAPVVDSARVAEIRQAIAEGRFKVNPDMVADRLIQTARELLSARYA